MGFKYKKFVITGDFLRIAPGMRGALFSFSNGNVDWVYDLLAPVIERVTSLPVEKLLWTSDGEGFDGVSFYNRHNSDRSTESWLRLYHAEPNAEDVKVFAEQFHDALVVGFELSPFQKKALTAAQKPWMSIAIHPLRFCEDFYFFIESNFILPDTISSIQISRDELQERADFLRARSRRTQKLALKPNSLLLCGQVEVDASLIDGHKMLSIYEFLDDIRGFADEYEHVYFKPHPHASDITGQVQALLRIPNVSVIDGNLYDLIAHDEIECVSAISSSVLTEAQFFGKKIKPLSSRWKSQVDTPCIDARIASAGFWKYILGRSKTPELSAKPFGKIKDVLNVAWSNTEPQRFRDTPLALNKPMRIGLGGNATGCIDKSEWWGAEKWGAWTKSSQTNLYLKVPPNVNADLVVRLKMRPYLGKGQKRVATFATDGFTILKQQFDTNNWTDVTLRIPKQKLSAIGNLKLSITLDGTTSPASISTESADTRELGIGLSEFQVGTVDNRLPISLGQTVDLAESASFRVSMDAGWSGPEEEGCWIQAQEATLRLRLSARTSTDVMLVLKDVQAFITPLSMSQSVQVKVNNEVVGRETFDAETPSRDVRCVIPKRIIADDGHINLKLRVSTLVSPLEAGLSNDNRTLGLRVRHVKFDSLLFQAARLPRDGRVNVIGPLNITTGLSVMARNAIFACQRARPELADKVIGLNFNKSIHVDKNYSLVNDPDRIGKINLFVGDPTRIIQIIREAGSGLLRNSYNICYGAWELEELPDYLASEAHIQEYWGLSTFIGDAAAKKMNVPVRSMPLPVNPFYPKALTPRKNLGMQDGKFTFLFVFCVDSTMSRKNPEGVLAAFQAAFPNQNDDVSLVIKCKVRQADARNRKTYADFKATAQKDPRVVIIEKNLSDQDMASVYLNSDAYVSLHRAEGYGLTIAEAMAYGKPAIATNYSGNLDFMPEQATCLVDYDMVQMDADSYHRQEQLWAEPDLMQAAGYMRRLFDDRLFRELKARRGREHIVRHFSLEAVGERMWQRLDEIEKGL